MNDRVHYRSTISKTPQQLKELRILNVAVIHPDDADGRQITQQLQRIGCRVQAFWPPSISTPNNFDVVFLAVRPDILDFDVQWLMGEDAPTVIAVVNYENPTIVEVVLNLRAKAVLPSPVRSFGLLSILVLAREAHKVNRSLQKNLRKAEIKLQGFRHVENAKNILMKTHNISESDAYELIRERAMSTRTTTEEVAKTIFDAHELLSMGVSNRITGQTLGNI
ncbi:MAG: ANTAR domain-containing protein [Comamonas sp.]|nr:ANTAR domain-containing protein [Comamonas sp.]